jgi:Ca2+-binding RTX toxin-like protein
MRRTTTLTTAGLLGLALLAPTAWASPATAAAETCQGVPATVVGTPEGHVVGTPGDDVIVSGGAWSVESGDGDDLVCIPPMEGDLLGNVVEVEAGAGDDTVVSEGDRNNSWVTLGPGVDTFRGGGWEDRVEAGFEDTVVADRGDDLVTYSIRPGEALPGTVGTMVADRSSGWIKVTAPGRRVAINGKAGEIRVDGHVVTTFGISPRMLWGVGRNVTLIGTSGRDRLVTTACGPSAVIGRGGNDEILRLGWDSPPLDQCPRSRMRADGGPGNDRITGTASDDILRGGGGNDWIKGRRGTDFTIGGPGRDVCRAERERACER